MLKDSKMITMSPQASAVQGRIHDCGGRQIAAIDGPNGSALDFYSLGKSVVIVQDFAGNSGIEVYFSRSEHQMKDIYAALEALLRREKEES